MHDLQTLQAGGYRSSGLTKLKLACHLDIFPVEILDLGDTLQILDLSGTGLSALPADFGARLPELKILFLSSCRFETFPMALARCAKLEMVAFRSNGMTEIPEASLPQRLRWLILTDNELMSLPESIGNCERLQKCMLAGNRLKELPESMARCRKLGLLRISSNRLEHLPAWLFELPELAFLSFAGNPCVSQTSGSETPLEPIEWNDLVIEQVLGEGASGVISKALRTCSPTVREEVAVKVFRGCLTSDGTPVDEMRACVGAGKHRNLIQILGQVNNHPDANTQDFQGGLVMELIAPHYRVLGFPPSLDSCTRDCFSADADLPANAVVRILHGIASAARHLHDSGINHGDLYAHNILIDSSGHALLGDFGAATVYRGLELPQLEKLEVLAFAHLIEDLLSLGPHGGISGPLRTWLQAMHRDCSAQVVSQRPAFTDIENNLRFMQGKMREVSKPGSEVPSEGSGPGLPN